MKNIKPYKLFEASAENIEKIFSKYINWDMIEFIKDISLDYMDDGYRLYLRIFYDRSILAEVKFSYNTFEINYYSQWRDDYFNIYRNYDKNKINYQFQINKNDDVEFNHYASNDILSLIKEYYPEENIEIREFYLNHDRNW